MTDAYSPKYAAVGILLELIMQQRDVAEILKEHFNLWQNKPKMNFRPIKQSTSTRGTLRSNGNLRELKASYKELTKT